MTVSLYDLSVGSYLQCLGAVAGFLDKGSAYCSENGVSAARMVDARLHPDMLPFRFQVVSVVHHSVGALRGMQTGLFKPPPNVPDLDYATLQNQVGEASDALQNVPREEVDALAGRDLTFEIGDRKIPFTTENFVLSFSLPNLYFHATTAYDILRMKGVPLGKRDFLGRMRIKR